MGEHKGDPTAEAANDDDDVDDIGRSSSLPSSTPTAAGAAACVLSPSLACASSSPSSFRDDSRRDHDEEPLALANALELPLTLDCPPSVATLLSADVGSDGDAPDRDDLEKRREQICFIYI